MVMVEQNFFLYKGYQLVRSGNCLYYGYMSDPYVTMIQVIHQDKSGNIPVADLLQVYQLSTNENKSIQTAKRPSLYAALDLARAWLSRAEQETTQQKDTKA